MDSVKLFFENTNLNYVNFISQNGLYNWNNQKININIVKLKGYENDRFITYETLDNLIYLFNKSIKNEYFITLNTLFSYYYRELINIRILNCPRIINNVHYIDYYDIDKMFKSLHCNNSKLFYKYHIHTKSGIDNILDHVFKDKLDKLTKNNVIINKDVYNKLTKDNRKMHNINNKLHNEIKLLKQQLEQKVELQIDFDMCCRYVIDFE